MIQRLGSQQGGVGKEGKCYCIYWAAVRNRTLGLIVADFCFPRGLSKILLQQNISYFFKHKLDKLTISPIFFIVVVESGLQSLT